MPRSAGTYTLPANSHAVSGNTISSTYFNNMIDDIASEITGSLPRDGSAGMSGVLKGTAGTAANPSFTFTGDPNTGFYSYGADQIGATVNGASVGYFSSAGWVGNHTGVVTFTDYQDVASATTTDIGAATSNFVNVTGTTTITGLGTVAAGTFRFVKFAAALTLTHNGTSLILPTGSNIVTAAGDVAMAQSLGSGNWKVLMYSRHAGLSFYPTATDANFSLLVSGSSVIINTNSNASIQYDRTGSAYNFNIGGAIKGVIDTGGVRGPGGAFYYGPLPTTSTGNPGQYAGVSGSSGAAVTLPAGGTWVYSLTCFNGSGSILGTANNIAAGGTTVGAATVGGSWAGWYMRIT